ncbi:MAG: hypothetical protein ACJAST_002360 [Halopseudomonas sp.]|jgi:hypothetical protein
MGKTCTLLSKPYMPNEWAALRVKRRKIRLSTSKKLLFPLRVAGIAGNFHQ